ncbi:MAG: endonuclease/exonuclease/phosphatase family protein, partial [Clostridia bacterium]|nr:endonuclease/exonuclease/phosphatase family protein [Clostridia bacterium]
DFSTCYYYEDCGIADTNGATAFSYGDMTNGTLLNGLNATSNVWEQGEYHPVLKTPARVELIPITIERYAGESLIGTQYLFLNKAGAFTLPAFSDFVKEIKINGVSTTETTFQIAQETTIELHLSIDAKHISEYNGAGSYFLGDADDMNALLTLSQTDSLSGCNVFLLADMDMSEVKISGGSFAGTLNGLYATVKNLQEPLFKEITAGGALRKLHFIGGNVDADAIVGTNRGRISDLTVQDMVFYGHYVGGIASINSGEITNCAVKNGYLIGHQAAGGIAAVNNGLIKDCINHASVVSVGKTVAGIVAFNSGKLESCINVGMLYGATRYAIAPSSDTTSYYWDWCVGEGEANALTDAALADQSMLDNLNTAVWEKGEKFPAITKINYERGDANGDHIVSIADALRVMKYLNGLVGEDEIDLTAADINGDGFSMPDAIRLLQSLNGAAPKAELPAYREEIDPDTVKIIDYNVRCGNDGTNKQIADRAPRLVRIVEQYQPDVIGLQEVVPEWMTYLEANFGDTYTIFNQYRAETSLESTPILYKTEKYNELDKGYFWLSETPDVESKGWDASHYRICNWVKLEDKATGAIFLFYNTHYDFYDKFREGASNLIINHATAQGGFTDYPVFLTGDFNMQETANGYQILVTDGPFEDLNVGLGYDPTASVSGYDPYSGADGDIIDYVFYSPDLITPKHYEVLNNFILGGYTSDHNGIYAEITLN